MQNYIPSALRTESKPTDELHFRLKNRTREVHAFFGLLTETGELADAFKRHIFYGSPLDLTNVNEEIGDILWYLAILMDACNVDFDSCMEANIRKLKARYPAKFNEQDAVCRDLDAERAALNLQQSPVAG